MLFGKLREDFNEEKSILVQIVSHQKGTWKDNTQRKDSMSKYETLRIVGKPQVSGR